MVWHRPAGWLGLLYRSPTGGQESDHRTAPPTVWSLVFQACVEGKASSAAVFRPRPLLDSVVDTEDAPSRERFHEHHHRQPVRQHRNRHRRLSSLHPPSEIVIFIAKEMSTEHEEEKAPLPYSSSHISLVKMLQLAVASPDPRLKRSISCLEPDIEIPFARLRASDVHNAISLCSVGMILSVPA